MQNLLTQIGTLAAGIGLIAVGIADLFAGEHLTLAGDIGFIVAGCGALGVHVNSTPTAAV